METPKAPNTNNHIKATKIYKANILAGIPAHPALPTR
jgi:hypothetical protein